MLAARAEAGKPVRAGLIGAGKFGSMFLAQAPSSQASKSRSSPTSIRIAPRRRAARRLGFQRIARTHFVERGSNACQADRVDVIVEATGNPVAGIAHALEAIEAGGHCDGQRRSRHARRPVSRTQSSRGRRDLFDGLWRPARVDRRDGRLGARPGFSVTAAGKGTKYLPAYHTVTPDHVWEHYGLTAEEAKRPA